MIDFTKPSSEGRCLECQKRDFSERNARKLLTILGRKALLTLQGNSPYWRVSFHDLQHDYLRAVAGDDIATLRGTFIDSDQMG